MLKHIEWRHKEARGRVAVFLNGYSYLIVKPIGGKNPPVELLISMLDASLPGWRRQAEEEFRHNIRPWKVDTRQGMSGCRDFCTRRLEDEMLAEVRTTARVHITMFWKVPLIEGYLGELAPIFARLREFYPMAEAHQVEDGSWEGELDGAYFRIQVLEPPSLRGFQSVDDTPSLGLWDPEKKGLTHESSSPIGDYLPEIEVI